MVLVCHGPGTALIPSEREIQVLERGFPVTNPVSNPYLSVTVLTQRVLSVLHLPFKWRTVWDVCGSVHYRRTREATWSSPRHCHQRSLTKGCSHSISLQE
jgi:hypothetical protein